jgi:hypothetical protein
MTDQERVKSAQALKAIKEDWPAIVERYALFAAMHRAKYLALVKEGFAPEQALELAKTL